MDVKTFENLLCGFFGFFLACTLYFLWILWQASRRPEKTSYEVIEGVPSLEGDPSLGLTERIKKRLLEEGKNLQKNPKSRQPADWQKRLDSGDPSGLFPPKRP